MKCAGKAERDKLHGWLFRHIGLEEMYFLTKKVLMKPLIPASGHAF